MSTFHLKISTPDGLAFDGEVERLRVRMIDGDVSLLAHHMDYVSAVGAGEAAIVTADGQKRNAACIGGMLAMINNEANLIATTFEWADDIDLERARHAREEAQRKLESLAHQDKDFAVMEAKLKRAIARINVKG